MDFALAFLGLQNADTQTLRALAVHFCRIPKRQIWGQQNLFCNVSYRQQQQQSSPAVFRSKEVIANPSIFRDSYVFLPHFKIGKLNQNTLMPQDTSVSRVGNLLFSLAQPSVTCFSTKTRT